MKKQIVGLFITIGFICNINADAFTDYVNNCGDAGACVQACLKANRYAPHRDINAQEGKFNNNPCNKEHGDWKWGKINCISSYDPDSDPRLSCCVAACDYKS